MSGPTRFRIPTLDEMESDDTANVGSTSVKKNNSVNAKPQTNSTEPSTLSVEPSKPPPLICMTNREESNNEASVIKALKTKPGSNQSANANIDTETSKEGSSATTAGSSTGKPVSSNSLLVNPRQRGNPILKSVRNVAWEYDNIVPDYVMGQSNCALFLSLRYHQLHPNYIHERLKQLGRSYDLRVMLVQVDVKDPQHLLRDLAKICILADCTLILAFSPEEAGRYLETYKIFENKPPEALMEKTEDNFMAKFTDCLTRVKSVNKTDCSTLLSHFGSLSEIADSSEEDLSLCPGFGPQKAQRLHNLFHEPFLRSGNNTHEGQSRAESSNHRKK